MLYIEDLLDANLDTAVNFASDLLPDIVAAFDAASRPLVFEHDSEAAVHYLATVVVATDHLTSLPSHDSDRLPRSDQIRAMLRLNSFEYLVKAPSLDGRGLMTALIDNLRGLTSGASQEYAQVRRDFSAYQFEQLLIVFDRAKREFASAEPLRRAKELFNLSNVELGEILETSEQEIEKWLEAGVPSDQTEKVGTMASIGELLNYRLRPGMVSAISRRRAAAYKGRTMLEVMKDDEHDWLLQSVRDSFDYSRTA